MEQFIGRNPELTNVGGTLYFSGNDARHPEGGSGYELWKSDGTEAGTVRVKDIRPGTARIVSSLISPTSAERCTSEADDGSGSELWKSDGTEAGTVRVKDIRAGSSRLRYLTNVNGTLYFSAARRQQWLRTLEE